MPNLTPLLACTLFGVVFAPDVYQTDRDGNEFIEPGELDNAVCANSYGNPRPTDCVEAINQLHPAVSLLAGGYVISDSMANDYDETLYEFLTADVNPSSPNTPHKYLPLKYTFGMSTKT